MVCRRPAQGMDGMDAKAQGTQGAVDWVSQQAGLLEKSLYLCTSVPAQAGKVPAGRPTRDDGMGKCNFALRSHRIAPSHNTNAPATATATSTATSARTPTGWPRLYHELFFSHAFALYATLTRSLLREPTTHRQRHAPRPRPRNTPTLLLSTAQPLLFLLLCRAHNG